MTFRHFLSWKPLFYNGLLPALRMLGPTRGDAILGGLGRVTALWPWRRRELHLALMRLRSATGSVWEIPAKRAALEANVFRYLARDCQLDGASDEDFFGRFDVQGFEHLQEALKQGRGVILVGSHLGAHLSANHWIYRQGLAQKLLTQRPQRLSHYQSDKYDFADDPNPQSGFFLKRNLPPGEAAKRIFRTRKALRNGEIVYLTGDVPWTGPNTRPARFLGHRLTFLSLWAEFAALFGATVVMVFCTHQPGGRHALTFEPLGTIEHGEEGEAVERYIRRLEEQIVAHPEDAVAHLLWSCYGPPVEVGDDRKETARRATRRQVPTAHPS